MTNFLKILLIASLFIVTVGMTIYQTNEPKISTDIGEPKRVILLLADGLGLQQITAGLYGSKESFNLEQIKIIGFHKNSSANHLTAEAGASTTAISCGVKTPDGCIGVDNKGNLMTSILEEVQNKDFATGIITNTSLTHPTPAAFYAHVEDENEKELIASFLTDQQVNFLVGGGKKYFDKRKTDERNLYQEMVQSGYQISDYSKQEFGIGSIDLKRNYCFFTADEVPLDKEKSRKELFYASKMALDFLKGFNKGNFFLVIQDNQIAIQSQENNSNLLIEEMINFDQLIGEVLDFAKKDKETLVVITGDHETGGFAINPGSTRDSIIGFFQSNKTTGTMMPVFAFGPGAELFSGIYDNVDIHRKLKQALDL